MIENANGSGFVGTSRDLDWPLISHQQIIHEENPEQKKF